MAAARTSTEGTVSDASSLAEKDTKGMPGTQDRALAILATHHVEYSKDSEIARRVKRKIDMHIMPLAIAVYLLQLIDKNSLSFAAIMGLKKDLHLTANQYSWLGSLVYFGYLAGAIPAVFLMQRVPLAKYFSAMCILWGIVMGLGAVCKTFASQAVARFLLGFIEVTTTPAVIYVTASFYTPKEQLWRTGLWYSCSGFANVFSGFFAWVFLHASSFRWEGLFVLYGGLTSIFGLLCWFFLAASPTDAKWLTEQEKAVALERVRNNRTGIEVWCYNKAQLIEAVLDPRLYLVFLLLVTAGLPNGGLTAFGPSIIASFGFTVKQATLLNMGSGACTVAGTLLAYMIAKYTNRTVAGVWTMVLSIVGVTVMLTVPEAHFRARYGGYILSLQFAISILFVITYITAGLSGTTKKFAFSCVYQIGYSVGNIIGPLTFRGKDAPEYRPAKFTMLGSLCLYTVLFTAVGLLHWYWNRTRNAKDAEDLKNGITHERTQNEEFSDLTDRQLRAFRYPL